MITTPCHQNLNPVAPIRSRSPAKACSSRAVILPLQCLSAAVVLALSGCAASIGTVTVAPGEPGERLEVSAAVKANNSAIRSVVLQTRPAGGTFTDVAPMTETGGKFRQNINSTRQGSFEAKVLVTYTPMFQSGNQTVSATKAFDLSFPAGTFDFATGGLNGWTFQGVFHTSALFQPCDPAALAASPFFSITSDGWPGLSSNGSVRVIVAAPCYPDNATEVDSGLGGFWEIHLTSPSLEGNAAWQGARGVSFRMFSGLPVQVVPVFVVQGANGLDEIAAPMISATTPDFTEIAGRWTIVAKTGFVPDRPIKRLFFRILGRPADVLGLPGANIQLDVVSPLR